MILVPLKGILLNIISLINKGFMSLLFKRCVAKSLTSENRRCAKQLVVQKLHNYAYRNLTYHVQWESIGSRHGAWLVYPDDTKLGL